MNSLFTSSISRRMFVFFQASNAKPWNVFVFLFQFFLNSILRDLAVFSTLPNVYRTLTNTTNFFNEFFSQNCVLFYICATFFVLLLNGVFLFLNFSNDVNALVFLRQECMFFVTKSVKVEKDCFKRRAFRFGCKYGFLKFRRFESVPEFFRLCFLFRRLKLFFVFNLFTRQIFRSVFEVARKRHFHNDFCCSFMFF